MRNHQRLKIGFYAPDPGRAGKSPNVVLAEDALTVTVFEVGYDTIITLQKEDWIDLDQFQQRLMEVATGPRFNNGGPMSDMRDTLLANYVTVLCKAVTLANDPNFKAPFFEAVA